MEPITVTAIIAALAIGVASGATDVGKKAVVDSYEALKAILKKKFGVQSEVVKSVEGVESNFDSPARKSVLQEEVEKAKVDQDPDIRYLAQVLLDQIKAQPGGSQIIKDISGMNVIGNITMQGKYNTSIGEASHFAIGDNPQKANQPVDK